MTKGMFKKTLIAAATAIGLAAVTGEARATWYLPGANCMSIEDFYRRIVGTSAANMFPTDIPHTPDDVFLILKRSHPALFELRGEHYDPTSWRTFVDAEDKKVVFIFVTDTSVCRATKGVFDDFAAGVVHSQPHPPITPPSGPPASRE